MENEKPSGPGSTRLHVFSGMLGLAGISEYSHQPVITRLFHWSQAAWPGYTLNGVMQSKLYNGRTGNWKIAFSTPIELELLLSEIYQQRRLGGDLFLKNHQKVR